MPLSPEQRPRLARRAAVSALATTALLLLIAPSALASDTVYWANQGNGTISFARLDGSGGGGQLPTTGAMPSFPRGVAIDPAAGRIYWANSSNTISFALLDGSGGGGQLPTTGATLNNPFGVAIDPAAGRIYWANSGNNTISFARLDGSGGGGQLPITGATPNSPFGVAIDLAAGRIYWSNSGNGTVSFARLDGSGGGGQLPITGATPSFPEGLAIDPAAGRIYWPNQGNNTISFARLDGSGGGGQLPITGATPNTPVGVAIDPAAGRIYWANSGNNTISFAHLDGSGGGGQLPTTGATAAMPNFPALLEAPVGAGAPTISGDSAPGSVLSCSEGSWAADLLGSSLYHAPQSFAFQWSRDGTDMAGATASSFTADAQGSYACRVTATNQAGSSPQTSASHIVASNKFSFGRLTRNKKRGTATLTVNVPGPGTLTLSGGGVVKQRPARGGAGRTLAKVVSAAGKVKLAVKSRGLAKFKLNRSGKVKVKVGVTFSPTGGAPASQTKTLRLIKGRAA